MLIDTHAHITAKKFYEAIEAMPGVARRPDPYGVQLMRDGKVIVPLNESWFEPGHSLREMDQKKIDVRLVSLTTPSLYIFPAKDQAEIAKRVNDECIATCKAHADRMRALPSLPLGDVEAALKELDRVASAPEVAGIAIGSSAGGVPLSDPRFEPVWARIDALRIPVVEHPMHPVFAAELQDLNLSILIGFMFDTQLMLIRLIANGVFERYPNIPFVVAHTGAGILGVMHRLRGLHDRNPESHKHMKKPFAEYLKGLYFDTCINDRMALTDAVEFLGAGRLMWGTDYPFVDLTTAPVDALDLSSVDKAAITGGTAQKLFKIKG
jgi:aminocarboxymuconate-semialdehyde decarboxylase